MKLKHPDQHPAMGGWWFQLTAPGGKKFRVPQSGSAGSRAELIRLVVTTRQRLGMPFVTERALSEDIEDTICDRLPVGECWSSGPGDTVHNALRSAAGAVDKVLGTSFKKKVTGCSGCKSRRAKMNAYGHKS